MMNERNNTDVWWKDGVIYHIYPQSFKDSNADGTGDIQGIIRKLDYLAGLGVDAIWLSPIYESPLIDGGYDISDYYSINPIYGTMEDFRELLHEAHSRQIRIIMDMVLNHTSNRHPWFKKSASCKDSPYRDWYIWHPPHNGKKPNNWKTNFGKSAWTFDNQTGEYYYHSFFKEQPDLNWRNPHVKQAMFAVIEYWLDMGVDGIRLDVINMIFKDVRLRNNPIYNMLCKKKVYNRNRPEVYNFLRQLRRMIDSYEDRITIGEIYNPPPGNSSLANSFLGTGRDMLHLAFDFSLIFSAFRARKYYRIIQNYYCSLPSDSWPCFVISNHDLGRNLKRYIFPCFKYKKAKVMAALLLTLKGTPFIYYGDEIGMVNTPLKRKDLRDRYGKMFYPFYKGRDKMRTPMQWKDTQYAGFSKARPWLPVHSNYTAVNVEVEKQNPGSLYSLYKEIIHIRRQHNVLRHGEIDFLNNGRNNILIYKRCYGNQEIIILLNFSFLSITTGKIPVTRHDEVLYSTHQRELSEIKDNRIRLKPFEVIIIKISKC